MISKKPLKDLPDNVKKQLCESFLKRVPEMSYVPLQAYKNAKFVLRTLKEKEEKNVSSIC